MSSEPSERTRMGWAVAEAASILALHVPELAALPPTAGYADGLAAGIVERDGLEAIASLRNAHRRARMRLGKSRLVHRLPGDCSGCGAWSLLRDDGSDTVRCGACDRRWSYGDYLRYVGMMLESLGMTPFEGPSGHADGQTSPGA
jgi:hypothetical protein